MQQSYDYNETSQYKNVSETTNNIVSKATVMQSCTLITLIVKETDELLYEVYSGKNGFEPLCVHVVNIAKHLQACKHAYGQLCHNNYLVYELLLTCYEIFSFSFVCGGLMCLWER